MLNNKRANHSSCAGGEQIISYLYGEINAAEKTEFEAHLQNCFNCADELANFGAVRSSILEWRDEEFSSIQTPAFKVPVNQQNKAAVNKFNVWFGKFRQTLTFKPILAAAAFGFVAIFIGLALLAAGVSRTDESAAKTDKQNSIEPKAAPSAENTEQTLLTNSSFEESETIADKGNSSTVFKEPKNAKSSRERGNRTNNNDSAVKISDNIKTVSNNETIESKIKNSVKANKKSVAVPKSQMPIYSRVEDEEDKSLRLADLFDEVNSE